VSRDIHSPARTTKRWSRLLLVLPALVAVAVYLPALRNGLVWDDRVCLVDSTLYRDPARFAEAMTRPFLLSPNYFRPLAVLSLIGELRSAGLDAAALHRDNVMLHGVNTLLLTMLLWSVLGAFGSRGWRAALAALAGGLAYGLHPALVEGVTFVSSRFDLLVSMFLLTALLAEMALVRRPVARGVVVGLCLLAAACCKEMAVVLVGVLPLWHVAMKRLGRAPRGWPASYLGMAAGGAAYLTLRYATLGYLLVPGGRPHVATSGVVSHVLLVARSALEYGVLLIWPFTTLSPLHTTQLPVSPANGLAWLALVFLVLAIALLVWRGRRGSAPCLLMLAVPVTLIPVLNVVPLELGGDAFVAERFLVFPAAVAVIAMVVAGVSLWRRWGARSASPDPVGGVARHHAPLQPRITAVAVGVAAVVWLVSSAVVVRSTLSRWQDDLSLWSWAVERAPTSAVGYSNLAVQQVERGMLDPGIASAIRAIELCPQQREAINALGVAYLGQGRLREAAGAFERAIAIDGRHALSFNNLAVAYRGQGRLAEAEELIVRHALVLDPNLPVAYLNLGILYQTARRPELALDALARARRLLPPDRHAEVDRYIEQARSAAGAAAPAPRGSGSSPGRSASLPVDERPASQPVDMRHGPH
jgi:hypothetical protein